MRWIKAKKGSSAATGFSLIEFAMVMTISGLVFASILDLYVVYAKRMKVEKTYERLFAANFLMTEAWNLGQRYYCPADPALQPGDPNYGRENCPAAGVTAGSCTNGATGVCVGAGVANELASSDVLIGMFPFVTITEEYLSKRNAVKQAYDIAVDPIMKASLKRTLEAMKKNSMSRAADLAFDGWGRQFTYAVTRTHTIQNVNRGNDRISGSIEIVNAALGGDSRRGVHFVIVSHGLNGKAAYEYGGVRNRACGDLTVNALEQENCDIDGRFIRPALISTNKGTADEADDIVVYNSYIARELWRIVACNTDGNPATQEFCIHNTNPGNVGIGKEGIDIAQKLTVDGQLRAEKIITSELCDANGTNCFAPDYIGGDAFVPCSQNGLAANQRRVAVQISQHTIRCETITMPGYNTNCPSGQIVAGFDSGGLICRDACTTNTQPGSTPCAPGESGQINYTTTLDCDATPPAWGPWQEVSRTCAPTP